MVSLSSWNVFLRYYLVHERLICHGAKFHLADQLNSCLIQYRAIKTWTEAARIPVEGKACPCPLRGQALWGNACRVQRSIKDASSP